MSRPFFYCSDLSRDAAELSFGTASIGEVWLLIEYREPWGMHALEDSALSAEVKRHLNRFCKTIQRSRILFIKQESRRPDPLVCFVVRSRERAPSVVKFNLSGYEDLLQLDATALAAGGAPAGGGQMDAPLFLVCTHGKRDKCCAKFGYALYKSLRAAGNEHVWQSSHVGGDRFAANLICFPHGLFYAHVTDEAGRVILSEYGQERRRLVLAGYRGRTCYSYPVQAAEFFIRTETGINAIDDLRYLRHERTGERSWLVKFTETGAAAGGRVHEAQVAARTSEFHHYITCNSTEEKRVVQYELADYRATIAIGD